MEILGKVDRRLVGVSPRTTIGAARRLAKTSSVDLLPVLQNGRLVGMVLGDDLERHPSEKEAGVSVEKIMRKPVFVSEDADANEVRKLLISHNLPRIPVVDSESSMVCVGTVSSSDLV